VVRQIDTIQQLMKDLYLERDTKRGIEKTFLKLIEEVGELAESIVLNNQAKIEEELADVIAWTVSIANIYNIDLLSAVYKKYSNICPKCKNNPCTCKFQ